MKNKILVKIFISFTIFQLIAAASIAASTIQTQKVSFCLADRTYQGQLVLPGQTHPANKLSLSLQMDSPGLKLIISDQLMNEHSARGAYVFRQNLLIVSSLSASNPTTDTVIQHEIVHAKIWNALRQGTTYVFTGLAFNDSEQFSTRQYGRFFGLDEIMATMFSLNLFNTQLKTRLDQLDSNKNMTYNPNYRESIYDIRTYIGRLGTMFTTLNLGLTEGKTIRLERNPSDLDFLPINLEWTQIKTSDIEIVLPLSSPEQLSHISNFAKYAIEYLNDVDQTAFEVDLLASENEKRATAQLLQKKVDEFVASFKSNFPKEATLLKF